MFISKAKFLMEWLSGSFNKTSPPLFAATGRGMQFSFSFLYNLIDDIHGRQPMINEGAEWHMSGTDSLLYVESSGKAELEQNLY